MKKTIAALMVCMLAVVAVANEAAIGKPAPGFKLPDINGQEHELASFAGKIVVLEWINHDCPFVKKFYAAGAMQKWQREYAEKGVVWLSICSSAPGKQGHFTAEQWQARNKEVKGAAAGVLLDVDGKVGKLYGAKTTPHMFVVDKEGKLVYAGAIDNQPRADAASLEGATNYVAAALEALLAGKPIETAETKAYGCSVKY